MIVNINKDNAGKYHNLFSEAYQFLKNMDAEKYPKDRFNNLAEYYGHMADFIAQGSRGYKYIMLPLDEEAFEINLNTRTIAVPASFSACASVQSDQLAETIMFVADRYFDYMDLATTQIFVQWETPEDKKNEIVAYKGATHIEMIDLESEPGKIKFAWPLNDIITAVPGVVKFSVRFCRLNDNNMNQLFYSLNTLESAINIRPALSAAMPADDNKIEKPFGENLFKHAVINSNYATDGVIPPTMPEFAHPGEDIFSNNGIQVVNGAKITHLNDDDTVTMYAQAHTSDANSIVEYKWYYKASDSDTYYACDNYPTADSFFGAELIRAGKDENGEPDASVMMVLDDNMELQVVLDEAAFTEDSEAGIVYFVKVSENNYRRAAAFNADAQYFILKDEKAPMIIESKNEPIYMAIAFGVVEQEAYLPCDMKQLREDGRVYREVYYKMVDSEPIEYEGEIDAETPDLYEKYTSFTVPAGNTVITGDYKVAAWGITEIDGKPSLKTPYPTNSSSCTIPMPNDIILTENLPLNKTLSATDKVLKVAVKEDPYAPELAYCWKGSQASSTFGAGDVISGATSTELTVPEIGWYQVDVSATLNRNPISISSNLCKVVDYVAPPRVTSIVTKQLRINPKASLEENVNKDGSIMSYDAEVTAKKIHLHIDADVVAKEGYDKALYTDTIDANNKITSFDYIWQMREPDNQKYTTLSPKNPVSGITFIEDKPNEIIVDSNLKYNIVVFRCLVVNNLNGKKAVFDHSCAGNFEASLGDFKIVEGEPQVPYIYESPETQKFVFNVSKFVE